jgi:hypothetical protein
VIRASAGALAVAAAACSAPAAHAPAPPPTQKPPTQSVGPERPFLDLPGLTRRIVSTGWSNWEGGGFQSWGEIVRDGKVVCTIADESGSTNGDWSEGTTVWTWQSGTSPLRFDVDEQTEGGPMAGERCTRYELPDGGQCRVVAKRNCPPVTCAPTFTVTAVPGTGRVTGTATRAGFPWTDVIILPSAGDGVGTDAQGSFSFASPPGPLTLRVVWLNGGNGSQAGAVDIDVAADQDLTVDIDGDGCSCCDQPAPS